MAKVILLTALGCLISEVIAFTAAMTIARRTGTAAF